MKIKYFEQSLIIDLSEINSPAKQTYLAYIIILPSFGSSNLQVALPMSLFPVLCSAPFHETHLASVLWDIHVGSFRKATQRAVRCRKQPTLTVLHSLGPCALQALSQMSDAAQPNFPSCAHDVTIHTLTKTACVIVCVHVMHERIPSPRKVS